MNSYNQTANTDGEGKRLDPRRVIHLVLITALVAFLVFLAVLFGLRLYSISPPKAATGIIRNDSNRNAEYVKLESSYDSKTGALITVFNYNGGRVKTYVDGPEGYPVMPTEDETKAEKERIDAIYAPVYQNFTLTDVVYSAEAADLQFTLRHNKSTVKYLKSEYGDKELTFSIYDNKGGRVIAPVSAHYDRLWNEFYRLSYTGVDLKNSDSLTIVITYGDVRIADIAIYQAKTETTAAE